MAEGGKGDVSLILLASSSTLVFEDVMVQRATRSFCRNLVGLSLPRICNFARRLDVGILISMMPLPQLVLGREAGPN